MRFPDLHDGIADTVLQQPAVWKAHSPNPIDADPFSVLRRVFPRKNRRERIELYAITGGVPKYIELFAESGDIYTGIQCNVLNRSGYLYDEPNLLLQQEVAEVGSYFSIIKAIAAGNSRLSAIASMLEVKATGFGRFLSQKKIRRKAKRAFTKLRIIISAFGLLLYIRTAALLRAGTVLSL